MSSRRTDGWLWLALLFAATGFVESMSFGHYLTFLPLLVRDLGVPQADVAATVGLLATTALIAGLPLVPFWGAWADRYSRKIIIVRSAVVEMLLFVLLAFVTDVRQLFLLVPLVGLVLGNTGVMLAEIDRSRASRAPGLRHQHRERRRTAGPGGRARRSVVRWSTSSASRRCSSSMPPSRASSCWPWSWAITRPRIGSGACCR